MHKFDDVNLVTLAERFDDAVREASQLRSGELDENFVALIEMWESIDRRTSWLGGESTTGRKWRVMVEAHPDDVQIVGWGACVRDYECDDPAFAVHDFLAVLDTMHPTSEAQHQFKITVTATP